MQMIWIETAVHYINLGIDRSGSMDCAITQAVEEEDVMSMMSEDMSEDEDDNLDIIEEEEEEEDDGGGGGGGGDIVQRCRAALSSPAPAALFPPCPAPRRRRQLLPVSSGTTPIPPVMRSMPRAPPPIRSTPCAPPPLSRGVSCGGAFIGATPSIGGAYLGHCVNTSATNSTSKYQVVVQTIKKLCLVFRKMVEDGVKIRLSIITFDTDSEIVHNGTDHDLTIEDIGLINTNIHRWSRPRGGTDIKSVVDVINDLTPEGELVNNILISDGYHNAARVDWTPMEDTFNTCIGIGSADDYDVTLLTRLAKDDALFGAQTAGEGRDYLINSIFGVACNVATDITVTIHGLTDLNTPATVEDLNRINMDNFPAYRTLLLTGRMSAGEDVVVRLSYTRVSDGEHIEIESLINSAPNPQVYSLVENYCSYIQRLIELTNTETTDDFKENRRKIKNLYALIKNSRERAQGIPALKNSFEGLFDEIKKMGIRETSSGGVHFRQMTQENYTVNRRTCQRAVTAGIYANVSRQVSTEYSAPLQMPMDESDSDSE